MAYQDVLSFWWDNRESVAEVQKHSSQFGNFFSHTITKRKQSLSSRNRGSFALKGHFEMLTCLFRFAEVFFIYCSDLQRKVDEQMIL